METILQAIKKPVDNVDLGYVGHATENSVNTQFLNSLLKTGITPTCCSLTHDGKGNLLNTNADIIAAEIAKAMVPFYEVELVYCLEIDGLLEDAKNPTSKIATVSPDELKNLKQTGVVSDGLHPLVDTAANAVRQGVNQAYLTHWEDVETPTDGTKIYMEPSLSVVV